MQRWIPTRPTRRVFLGRRKEGIPSYWHSIVLVKGSNAVNQRQYGTSTTFIQRVNGDKQQARQQSFLTEECKARTRHLLRALLRECAYLPLDPFARQWTTSYILARFRTYKYRAGKAVRSSKEAGGGRHDRNEWEQRFRGAEKEARKGLADLRRANEGERGRLVRVLCMAYGRVGKRRRQLMVGLTRAPGAESESESGGEDEARLHESDEASMKAHPTPTASGQAATQPLQPTLTPPLLALLRAQIQASPPEFSRRNPKVLVPSIPALNAWLRPLPASRVENQRQKLTANLLDRALPPLPLAEFARLHALASGKAAVEVVARRRPVNEAAWEKAGGAALETVVQFGKVPARYVEKRRGKGKAHALTPRFLQRVYREVFVQCCYMRWETEGEGGKGGWRVVWGLQAMAESASGPLGDGNRSDVVSDG